MLDLGINHADPRRLQVMHEVVASRARPGFRVLEIGSYEGVSALAWCEAINSFCGSGSVLCIDTWRSYVSQIDEESQPICKQINEVLESGVVFNRFLSNIRQSPASVPVSYLVGSLPQNFYTIKRLFHPPFDVVYIDGDHAYDSVTLDLAYSIPLVPVGGILCGDDLERQLHECDKAEVEANKDRNWVGYHPGVTLAVGQVFDRVWAKEGFWAMCKTETGWEPPFS